LRPSGASWAQEMGFMCSAFRAAVLQLVSRTLVFDDTLKVKVVEQGAQPMRGRGHS
jgi:hypothetical protein